MRRKRILAGLVLARGTIAAPHSCEHRLAGRNLRCFSSRRFRPRVGAVEVPGEAAGSGEDDDGENFVEGHEARYSAACFSRVGTVSPAKRAARAASYSALRRATISAAGGASKIW